MKLYWIRMSFLMLAGYMVISQTLRAQSTPSLSDLSLPSVVELALSNKAVYRSALLDEQIAGERRREMRMKYLPQLYADGHIRRNLIIPTQVIPLGGFQPGGATEVGLQPVKFGTNWQGTAGITLDQPLFDSQLAGMVRESELGEKISRLDGAKARETLIIEVSRAYYQVLVREAEVRFAAVDTARTWTAFAEKSDRFTSGQALQTDINQTRIDHQNARSAYANAQLQYTVARKNLLFRAGLDPGAYQTLTLRDNLESLARRVEPPAGETDETLLNRRVDYQQTLLNRDLNRLKERNERAAFLPSLRLQGFLGANHFSNAFRFFNGNTWFGNSYVGLAFRLPLTEGLERVRRIGGQKLRQEQDGLQLADAKLQLNYQLEEARSNFAAVRQDVDSRQATLQLARENLRLVNARYQEGQRLGTAVREAETSLRRTELDYLQSLYNYLDAALELQRVQGVLNP